MRIFLLVGLNLEGPVATKIHCDFEIITSVRVLKDMPHKSVRRVSAVFRNRGVTATEAFPADTPTGLIGDPPTT